MVIELGQKLLHDPGEALAREWLVANGMGGYASSTVLGANTRSYHGLLVVSFPPPLERQVLLAKVDEELVAGDIRYPLGSNEFRDGTIHPQGFLHMSSFRLELGIPAFTYRTDEAEMVKQVWMIRGANAVFIRYTLRSAPGDVELRIRPFCAFRSYHGGQGDCRTDWCEGGEISVTSGRLPCSLHMRISPGGVFDPEEDWHHGFVHREERARGFHAVEDLYTPGVFSVRLSPGGVCTLIAGRPSIDVEPEPAFHEELLRRAAIAGSEPDPLRAELLLAADSMVVENGRKSILAGYHWFTDWGRDTMISLPGLLLSTQRYSDAREILLEYGRQVDQGAIPNRFCDSGEPEYNTADASLWYFEAVRRYLDATEDTEFLELLLPQLREIVDRHLYGTRFGLRVDTDGLLHAGQDGTQLTWMDARVDGAPVTPRVGKPVEVNALWYNALCLISTWLRRTGEPEKRYEAAARKFARTFGRRFWRRRGSYLLDVVDGPGGDDPSLRPNQILAVSLPHSPLSARRRKAVVDAVGRHLLTPFGLRTLSSDHPSYTERYEGGPRERDSAYHQGTAWPWLLGAFADAHYRVYNDRDRVIRLLEPFRSHLAEAGLGSVSEIFDGHPPHAPRGCISQAWSVAELLRIAVEYAPTSRI